MPRAKKDATKVVTTATVVKKVAKKPRSKTKAVSKPRKKKTSVNQILIDSPSILAVNPVMPGEPEIAYNPASEPLKPVFVTQVTDLAQTLKPIPALSTPVVFETKADAPALPEVIAEMKRFKQATDGIDLEWSDIDPDAPKPSLWHRTKRFFKEFFGG
jgi:hypothetical protein